MKKIAKLSGIVLASLAILLVGCKKDPDEPVSTPIEIPTDAVRFYADNPDATDWSIYGVEDLEALSEIVNDGDDFAGKTVTVKRDIVINNNLLSEDFDAPEEGEDASPNPNFKNLNSIGTGASPDSATVNPFKGTFDGNGKVISGLYMYQGHQGLGLIGIADGATVKNVIILDACVINKNVQVKSDGSHDGADDDRFGGLVGATQGEGVTIENCLFVGVLGSETAKKRGSPYEYIGGLIGRCEATSSASDSFVFVKIHGSREDSTDFACGRKPENLSRTNINGEDDKGVEVSSYDEEIAAQVLDAVAAVKANLQ